MGEAKRPTNRSDDDGMSGPYLQVSFDHIWPGAAESCFARVDPEHPDRAERCKGALLEVSDEIATGRGKCAECGANIVDLAGLGECSVAHVWNTPKAPSIGIPFCRRCAASEEAVSRLAKVAVEKVTGTSSARLQ
jgi:hypothetical protein